MNVHDTTLAAESLVPTEPTRDAKSTRRIIAFFGHDSNDSAIKKRISAFRRHGSHVIGFTFRRGHAESPSSPPPWDNVDLGTTVDMSYACRLWKLTAALPRIVRHGRRLRESKIFYARNIDMLLVAVLARWMTRSRACLVYEVLDVRPVFTDKGAVSRIFRWAERRLLNMSDMLVVSAPDYMTYYFEPVQRYDGAWHLLENKLLPEPADLLPTAAHAESAKPPPWRIGWFGVLKCARSLEILSRIAAALPDTVRIVIRGIPAEKLVPMKSIEAATAQFPNIEFHGRYAHPDDLAEIYNDVHLVWAADFLDAGANSDWCLANRIYEGGCFGCVAIAAADTATGRYISRTGLGVVLPEPLDDSVRNMLCSLRDEDWQDLRRKVAAAPRSLFIDHDDTRQLLASLDRICERRLSPAPTSNSHSDRMNAQ